MQVTVQEAASRLGITPEAVRRRLRTGGLRGDKVGPEWHIDEDQLPPVGQPLAAAASVPFSDAELDLAVQHLLSVDLSELWIPDVLRWGDLVHDAPSLRSRVRERVRAQPPEPATEVRVPKNALASRSGLMLDFIDRVAYQAAVARLAPDVEAATSDRVFSSRLSSDGKYFLEHSVRRYVSWRTSYLSRLREAGGLLVLSDLNSYFDTIDQPTLLRELEELTGQPETIGLIRAQLKQWSVLLHRGIPQGPNASRLLGNAYMLPVDQAMLDGGFDYWRYMDDIAIIVADHAEASRAVASLEHACHARGLLVSSAKTLVQTLEEAEKDVGKESKDFAEYLLQADAARGMVALRRIFAGAVPASGPIDVSDAKFALWRLARRLDGRVMNRLLARLDDLGPVASVSAVYLRQFLSRPRVVDAITDFLHDPERNTSDYLECWLFAAMLEFPRTPPDPWVSRARVVAHDRNRSNAHRVLAMNLLALGRRASDIASLKRAASLDRDQDVARGALVALHRVSKLDASTQAAARTRHPDLAKTVAYLQGRRSLPSLVYRGRLVATRT